MGACALPDEPRRKSSMYAQMVKSTGKGLKSPDEMSADERAAFADRLEEAMTRTSRRGGTIRQR